MNQALPRSLMIDGVSPPRPPIQPEEDEGFGFADLLSVVLSQRLLMLAVIALTLAAGGVFIYFQPPMYEAEALVALGPGQVADVSKRITSPATMEPDTALVESEVQILRSNDMMNRLIAKIGPGPVAKVFRLRADALYAGADAASPRRRELVQALQQNLKTRRQQTSNVIAIDFTAPTAATAAQLANTLVDVYLESKVDERLEAAQRARVWLDQRVNELGKEVELKEAAVAAYRADTKLLSIDGATITEQQYFKLQGEVVAVRAELAEKQARLGQIRQIDETGGDVEAVLEAVSSPTIQALRQREAEIAGREAELKQRYFDAHPAVQQVHHEYEQVQQQITAEVSRIKSSLANEVEVSRARLRELETGLAQLEGGLVEGNRAIVRLKELEREAESASLAYRDFLLRAREIADQESFKVVDARGVSRAILPAKPSSASPTTWMTFFFAGGLFLALIGAIARAAFNDRIMRPETISRRLGVPTLVSVPLIHRHQLRKLPPDERTPEDYLVNQPMTAFAESLRVLGANLLSDFDTASGLAVAVTSAVAAEGKTTVSLSLSRAAAMSGLRVLVVDCDARRPSLSAGLADKPQLSLIDVIKGGVTWQSAAVADPLTSAVVLPINATAGQLQSLFRPDAMRKLLAEVRPSFDLIVMDCPPVLAVAETRWLTAVADRTIVVTHWNKTRASAVRTALREVMRSNGRIAGVVLNRLDVAVARQFSFSDSLYYGNAGKGYYTK